MTDQDRDTLTRLIADLKRRAVASRGPYGFNLSPYMHGVADGVESAATFIETAFAGTDAPLVTAWQLIETAPTDGTNVLLFVPNYAMGRLPYVIVQGWNLDADRRGWRSQYGGGVVEPSHWMPLQTPPSQLPTLTSQPKGTE